MSHLKPLDQPNGFIRMIGTGGIGSGMFFQLEGNHTLGRNESRMGTIAPFKDYCKQHIITHYVAVLLGASEGKFEVIPIGNVGEDEIGLRLVNEMKAVGMNTSHISIQKTTNTLYSVCFQYPDSTGGNMTTADSASSQLKPEDIVNCVHQIPEEKGKEMILAAPEVPLESRIQLLEIGRERKSFNAASILSSEVDMFTSMGGYEKTDLLAVNIDEARAIGGIEDESISGQRVVEACIDRIICHNPDIYLSITDGPNGSYGYHQDKLEFIPTLPTDVIATGGAGDAHLSGILVGLCSGLAFLKGRNDQIFSETPILSAMELGNLLASLTVTSPDTIHQTADAIELSRYAKIKGVVFSPEMEKVFGEC
jgi:sugar/nucleoside kinase (ribokinase family)